MRLYWVGFIAALVLFLTANVLAAHLRSDCGPRGVLGIAGCADDFSRAGWTAKRWWTQT